MRLGLLRAAIVLVSVVWAARNLACHSAATNGNGVDRDGDGLSDIEETAIYGTSPALADTDGDGMTDGEEIARGFAPTNDPIRFNPRVADVPMLELQITSEPLVTITLTETTGEIRTFEVARTFEESLATTVGVSQTIGWVDEVSEALEGTVDLSDTVSEEAIVCAAEVDDENEDEGSLITVTLANGNSSTTSRAVARTVGRASAREVTLSFSNELSRQITQAVTLAESYSETHEITASGGSLKLLIVMLNRGNLPVRVTNLELSASLLAPDGSEIPVGNLHVDTINTTYQPFSVGVGEAAGPVNFVREFLSLETVARLLRDLRGIVVRVGIYELSNAKGESYVFDTALVGARTATIAIDYRGRAPPERYMVATNLDPARPGVTAERVLAEILRIPFECDPTRGSSPCATPASESSRWSVRHRHRDGRHQVTTTYGGDEAGPYD